MENLNVLFQDMKLEHVEFDQVRHYLFEIIPNNLKRSFYWSFFNLLKTAEGFYRWREKNSHEMFLFISMVEFQTIQVSSIRQE